MATARDSTNSFEAYTNRSSLIFKDRDRSMQINSLRHKPICMQTTVKHLYNNKS